MNRHVPLHILRISAIAALVFGAAVSAQAEMRADYSGASVHVDGTGADVNAAGAAVVIRGNVGDLKVAGAALDVRATVAKDVKAAGAQILIDSAVTGDIKAGGGLIEIRGKAASVSVGGAVVRLDAIVTGNVRAGGATVDIGPNSDIAGELTAGGAVVNIEGKIAGPVRIGGAVVTFNASAGGVVTIESDTVTIGSKAVVTGDLIIRSRKDPVIEQGASVTGQIRHEEPQDWWRIYGWVWNGIFAVWIAGGAILAGFLLLLATRGAFGEAVDNGARRSFSSFFLGLATTILLPVVAAIIMATVVGISFGFGLLLIMPLLFAIGHAVAATCVGAWLLDRGGANRGFARLLGLLIVGAIIIAAVWQIPYAGPALGLIAILIGLGAFFRTLMARLSWRSVAFA